MVDEIHPVDAWRAARAARGVPAEPVG